MGKDGDGQPPSPPLNRKRAKERKSRHRRRRSGSLGAGDDQANRSCSNAVDYSSEPANCQMAEGASAERQSLSEPKDFCDDQLEPFGRMEQSFSREFHIDDLRLDVDLSPENDLPQPEPLLSPSQSLLELEDHGPCFDYGPPSRALYLVPPVDQDEMLQDDDEDLRELPDADADLEIVESSDPEDEENVVVTVDDDDDTRDAKKGGAEDLLLQANAEHQNATPAKNRSGSRYCESASTSKKRDGDAGRSGVPGPTRNFSAGGASAGAGNLPGSAMPRSLSGGQHRAGPSQIRAQRQPQPVPLPVGLQNAAAVARGLASPNNPNHNWQSSKISLKERVSFMFCNEIQADVHFSVGRGDQRQRIPAHKFILTIGSAVFDAMFNGAMANRSLEDDVDLPDVEPAAFLALLRFLYSDDVQIGPESVMTTLYTAKKYAVPALENACVEFLKRSLNPDNAFMLLTQARLFDEQHLAALCLEMIDKHTIEALVADGFTDIDLATLCAVLERDTLRIREVALFQAVIRWSLEECRRQQLPVTPENQRNVLGRALQLVRFPQMTVEEFAQSAAQSGILTDRQVVALFLYFTVNPKPAVAFLDVPRCCVTGKEQSICRFQRIEGRWGYSGTPDRIKFVVDRRIFVVGFGLYGSYHGPSEYSVQIQIIHCGTGKVSGSNDTSFQCDGSLSTFRVLFKEPVEISPNVTYIASAAIKGVDSHYGTKGLRRIVHQSSATGSVTFQFTYAAGNNNGTSVEDGQIPEIIFYTNLGP